MYALKLLRRAVYAALTQPALQLDGAPVPVFEHAPKGQAYVLLSQPTQSPTGRTQACQLYDCTMLLDCCTGFATQGVVSSDDADTIAGLVFDRLQDNRFAIGPGWETIRATVDNATGLPDFDQEKVDVHRYLRLRWSVAYTPALLS